MKLLNTSPVKSIQRGTASLSSALDITIAKVNREKAFINLMSSGWSQSANSLSRGELTTDTNLRLRHDATTRTANVSWEVIEYV
ncbi:hypothetical protein [Thalassotalea hakodatensis]|uniref:hypothetical protein n=1 Tax=Thalassotalea hakodatensis TaxID=3030492 RepID=UPI0025727058|nr:hypothetical protein [Thalassotalea hakodatensis]